MTTYSPLPADPSKITERGGIKYYNGVPLTTDPSKPQYYFVGSTRMVYYLRGDTIQPVSAKAGEGYGEAQYNLGAGASVSRIDTPTATPSPTAKVVSDPSGNVKMVEDYSKQGGGRYETVIAGPSTQPGGGFSGSGYGKTRVAALSQPTVQESILAAARTKPAVSASLQKAGLIEVRETTEQTRPLGPKPGEYGYHATQSSPGGIVGNIQASKPIPLFDPVTGRANVRYEGPAPQPEFKRVTEYGTMIRSDIAEQHQYQREQEALKSVMPRGITPSSIFIKSSEMGATAGKKIRSSIIDTSFLPTEIKASAGYKGGKYLVSKGRESVARAAEYGGTIIPTAEVVVKSTLKDPSSFPKMVAVGTIVTAGGIAKQAQREPTQLLSDILVTGGILKGAGKAKGAVSDTIKFTGKTYVPPETIIEPQVLSGAERFPLAPRGTTGGELVKEFRTSKYRIPGTEGKIGGWHATPEEFAKTTKTQAGTSESPGLYIAPSTSPHFWKIDKQFKLFGLDVSPETPAGLWIGLKGIKRSPLNVRTNIGKFNRYLTEKAQKGTAYISSAFEKGAKPEKEAIIPPETPMERVSNKYYTKFKGKKVPLMEYSATQKPLPEPPESFPFDFGGQHGITVTRSSKGMVLVGGAGVVFGTPKAHGKEETTFGELSRKQSRTVSEYRAYREPIFTEKSLAGISRRSSGKKGIKSSTISMRKSLTDSSRLSSNKSMISSTRSTEMRGFSSIEPSRTSGKRSESLIDLRYGGEQRYTPKRATSKAASRLLYRPIGRAFPMYPTVIRRLPKRQSPIKKTKTTRKKGGVYSFREFTGVLTPGAMIRGTGVTKTKRTKSRRFTI